MTSETEGSLHGSRLGSSLAVVWLFLAVARLCLPAERGAARGNITGTPETNQTQVTDGVHVQQVLWRNSKVEVEHVAIYGGGHLIPQPYWRYPRGLGPTPKEPNGPDRQ